MPVQIQTVQDNSGSGKGSLDLGDQITIQKNGQTTTITVENYLSSTTSEYDGNLPPNERLANVIKVANRLPVNPTLVDFLNNKTELWNTSHPKAVAASGSQATQCSKGTTFVAASGLVTDNFCIDNVATKTVKDPTWQEATDFCAATGKFLLTYEQEKLGAKFTSSEVVRDSGKWEWLSKSNGDDSQGLIGGFFGYDYDRRYYDEYLLRGIPDGRSDDVAFRCGGSPSPQDPKK